VKVWDSVIIGGGIIGLSLALELRKDGARVVVLDASHPGREASWAAGGMLAARDPDTRTELRDLAIASASMYPEFVHQVQDESGTPVDFCTNGTIRFLHESELMQCALPLLSESELRELEPELEYTAPAVLLAEACVDPRLLLPALVEAAKHRDVDIASGAEVQEIEIVDDRVVAAVTTKTRYAGAAIVNCAGAWSSQVGPLKIPTRPVKGQMLALAPLATPANLTAPKRLVHHVIRGNVYIIPRGDGRIVVGSTLEEAGFNKRVDAATIQSLHQQAANLVPSIGQARILQDWAGLRPATPDGLPILGRTDIDGCFVATGHYRDGILLAPITAKLMSQVIRGEQPEIDIAHFQLNRFQTSGTMRAK
jgi:glycine oxidase